MARLTRVWGKGGTKMYAGVSPEAWFYVTRACLANLYKRLESLDSQAEVEEFQSAHRQALAELNFGAVTGCRDELERLITAEGPVADWVRVLLCLTPRED